HLASIADTLISAGLAAATPGAVVSDGWTRQQRVVTAPLAELADAVKLAGVTNPAVVVIGDVAQLTAGDLLVPGAPAPARPPPPPAGPPPPAPAGPPPPAARADQPPARGAGGPPGAGRRAPAGGMPPASHATAPPAAAPSPAPPSFATTGIAGTASPQ